MDVADHDVGVQTKERRVQAHCCTSRPVREEGIRVIPVQCLVANSETFQKENVPSTLENLNRIQARGALLHT